MDGWAACVSCRSINGSKYLTSLVLVHEHVKTIWENYARYCIDRELIRLTNAERTLYVSLQIDLVATLTHIILHVVPIV